MNKNILKEGLNKSFNPKHVYNDLKNLSKFAKLAIIGLLLLNIIIFVITKDFTKVAWFGLVANLFMVVNLILLDFGKISNYFWGLISVSFWFLIALNNNAIGDQYTQIFALSMQFVGSYLWIKDMDKDENVIPKELSKRNALLILAAGSVIYGIVLFTSLKQGGVQPYLISALLPINIISMILMVLRYKEQWIGWIGINAINVVIWTQFVMSGTDGSVIMLSLQIFMLLNSLYGYYDWAKRFKKLKDIEVQENAKK